MSLFKKNAPLAAGELVDEARRNLPEDAEGARAKLNEALRVENTERRRV